VISQDTTSYGIDIYGSCKLVELLRELSKIEELKWIRLLYMYPGKVTD
jgi:ribosomal protein S12 methylthiotransferase